MKQILTFQVDILIAADNYFGARHGIETLLQFIVWDEISNLHYVPSFLYIDDVPEFKHRGLMLDTSRNYYSVAAIKRLLDGMALNKLNIFHWHLTDSQSFPFKSKRYPQLSSYGAYSPSQVGPKYILSYCNIISLFFFWEGTEEKRDFPYL